MPLSTVERDQIILNILAISDSEDWIRIKQLFPGTEICPTCDGNETFILKNKSHVCDCQLQINLQRAYYIANIGKTYHPLSLDDFIGDDKDVVVPAITKYVESLRANLHGGHGLTFNGPIGTGKTFALTWILKQCLKQGYEAYFIDFSELINIWANSWKNDEAKWLDQKLRSVQFLGIDELRTDSRNSKGFLSQGMEVIIRHRTNNNKPTLITTNLDSDQEEIHFTRSYSLLSAKNERVETSGSDVRGNKVRLRDLEMRNKGERKPVS